MQKVAQVHYSDTAQGVEESGTGSYAVWGANPRHRMTFVEKSLEMFQEYQWIACVKD